MYFSKLDALRDYELKKMEQSGMMDKKNSQMSE
jgi:hypothetical protein